MQEEAISIENLSVSFRKYIRQGYTMKEAVLSGFRTTKYELHWPIKDLSLKINRGERLGILGENGTGKSTLLRVIAGILKPTKGLVRVHGKISPLLNLGGGFKPTLTGRENVILYGSILGRTSAEMKKRMDSIVDFADVGDFIDAPLKTYSSGMRARLGFAVATDIEPDILLLDEVLGVGDMKFSKKAKKRINDLFENGATVILVSHSVESIKNLFDRAIYLKKGGSKVLMDGSPADVVATYRNDMAN